MASIRTLSYPFLFVIIVCCTTLWILHSLYFLLRYEDSTEKTILLRKPSKQLSFPALIICNRMPFSQEGLRKIPLLYQDYIIRYLHEWVDPSLRLGADYTPLSTEQQIHAQQLIAQSVPQSTRASTLSDAFIQCQNVINSCRFQGRTMTAAECCRSVRMNIPTVNGICWSFKDKTLTVNNTALNNDFQITFQIPRDSYYTSIPSTYPGIDVYLVDSIEDQWKLATGLSNPLRLIDKKGVRFRFHKEVSTDLRRSACGTTSRSAQRADQIAFESNRTKLFGCILIAVIRHCQCHPLYSEFLKIDPSKMRELSQQINKSDVCTLDSYDNCARAFVQFALRSAYNEPLPSSDSRISTDIAACRSHNHIACTEVKYSGNIDDYILPQEFQTTTDFFTRLTLAYETMLVNERLTKIDLNIYELISLVGYNLALWFSIGHIIWSLFRIYHDFCTVKPKEETKKRNSVVPLLVQPENRRNSNTTPMRRLDVQSVTADSIAPASPKATSSINEHTTPQK